MPLSPGQALNARYRIVKLVAQGGFGAVYRAWDLSLNKPCAVKENFDASAAAQKQFMQEASILASLSHPTLPRVTDHFFIPGQGQYLVMDFVEGEDLQVSLDAAGGPLRETQVLPWMLQVCDALTYLHNQTPSIIHRDVKPANIKITPAGQAMLVDFGIAKVYDPNLKTTLGARGLTPGYSPPEQYGKGGQTDARSDVYALGATLYAALTGQEPPESPTRSAGSLLPSPRSLNLAISVRVDTVILRAMEMVPAQRYQTAAEFKAALMGLAGGAVFQVTTHRQGVFPFQPSGMASGLALGGTVLVVLLSLVGLYFLPPFFAVALTPTLTLEPGIVAPSLIPAATLASPPEAATPRIAVEDATMVVVRATAAAGSTLAAQLTQTKPSPAPPTNTLRPTQAPSPTSTAVPTVSPDQFIRDYCAAISDRQYEWAWSVLSDAYKARENPGGIDPYKVWWDKVERLDVDTFDTQTQTAETAIVVTTWDYDMNDGRKLSETYTIGLIADHARNSWLIDTLTR